MRKLLVLVVDDVRDNREMYIEYLRYVGFRCVGAEDGESAIRMARELQPAMILMDLSLPGVDGWEATRILKTDPETKAIPIVAVSGHAEPDCRTRALALGCDLFIAKPALPSDLTEEVLRLLDDLSARGARGRR
jgi:two-component system, cell cycle response regulator DivK